ncbi:MAG: DUF3667 domain-containing protein [Pseudomonadota bacterium]
MTNAASTDSSQVRLCQNCGTVLAGEYCHVCGQKAEEPRRAVLGLVQDVFVDTLAIDGKLFRTLWLLLTRPGRLARRYLDGKRVRYSPPFRLYLFASVFFFFTAFLILSPDDLSDRTQTRVEVDAEAEADSEHNEDVAPERRAAVDEAAEELDAAAAAVEDALGDEVGPQIAEVMRGAGDAAQAIEDEDQGEDQGESEGEDEGKSDQSLTDMSWDDLDYNGPDWFAPIASQLFEAGQRAYDDPRLFFAHLQENLPRTMLLAPVFYAVILVLLYFYRRKYYVYDHLVVSLYMHAALYAHLLLALLVSQIPLLDWVWVLTLGWAVFLPYAVFRQAYRSNWVSVFLKGVISTSLYAAVFALLITLGLTYSLYTA